MRYPNSNMTYQKKISHANRGMNLEEQINDANKYYLDNDVAVIRKISTPIGIVNVNNDSENKNVITKAYFKEKSTLDYCGVYKGRYIEFDAKETNSKTSFSLNNIPDHQIIHMEKINKHGAVSFIIININNENYIYSSKNIIEDIKNNKKSIKYEKIKSHGIKIKCENIIQVDYIKALDILLEVENEKEN